MSGQRWSNLLIAIVGGAVGASVVAMGLPGRLLRTRSAEAAAYRGRTLRAGAFVLVDRRGARRAELHFVKGEPVLEFYGRKGRNTRVSLGVGEHQTARARFYSSDGVPQAGIGVTREGRPGVALLDRQRHLRGSFDVSMSGEPMLRLYDDSGPRIGLDVTEAGSPGLVLLDPNGKTRAAMVLGAESEPALTLYGVGGKSVAALP